MEQQLYLPNNSTLPTKYTIFRVGLQGRPKTGKTWSALTFPNPFIVDIDNNIPRNHPQFENLHTAPLWNDEWIKNNLPRASGIKHNALIQWLKAEGPKFKENQTIILDSITFLGNYFDAYYQNNPVYSGKGVEDKFAPWRFKIKYFTDLHEIIKGLSCNFVGIIHETNEYDEDGTVIGIKPLLTGQFGDQIAGHYCEWFRQVVEEDKTTGKLSFLWEVKSKKLSCAGGNIVSILPADVKRIPANYETLVEITTGKI